MVHAARASAPHATAPPCPNQSLAKHNRKPIQLTENKHQRSNSIASFFRTLLAPPLPTHAFLIGSRPLFEIELTRSQQTRKYFLTGGFSGISWHRIACATSRSLEAEGGLWRLTYRSYGNASRMKTAASAPTTNRAVSA